MKQSVGVYVKISVHDMHRHNLRAYSACLFLEIDCSTAYIFTGIKFNLSQRIPVIFSNNNLHEKIFDSDWPRGAQIQDNTMQTKK